MKKSIIIYTDCIAILEELTFEQAGRLFKAILAYANEEPVTEINDTVVKMAYKVICRQIDRDAEKYEEKCEKNRQIAIAREQRRRELRERERTSTNVNERERTSTNVTYNDTDSDNDSDNDTDSDNEFTNVNNKLPLSLRSKGSSHSKADATQPKNFREKVLQYFNERMACKSIKPIKAIKDGTKRSDSLKARVREYGRDAVLQMIDRAASSQFLNGYNAKGFVATFDWLVLPNNFIKVLEGNYDNGKANGVDEQQRAIAEEREREQEERERQREEDRQTAVSYDEWLAMKGKHNDLK